MTYPVSLHDRKYLVITSFLFFIPALRALYFQVPLLGTMSFLTGCASLNFWAFGLNNWRLTLDKTVAYSTTVCYYLTVFSHVIRGIAKGPLLIAYLLITLCAAQSFSKSWEKWNMGCSTWIIYHMLFHVSIVIGNILVVEVEISL